ncbi:DUF3987 domain-containing protein [Pinibacter aurantiacus]|uniref:DUF3987 domain-containing protein n=1 Tax=Pinibacter aurantiacus TaxID=2851599 RepID=A0A9E2W2Z2_9BACT|nr:DUF3987 domain-containing protein [Pinibacter aurantiacus]MBV4356299.1 DUF3987 domain-containing protein [Pinibacter aurantiacus]
MKRISMFDAGIKNTVSIGNITLTDLPLIIKCDEDLRIVTAFIRGLTSKEKQNEVKCYELKYVTFGGTFSIRKDSGLIEESGLICIDIDEIENPPQLKKQIIAKCEFLLLAFISPRGNGLKLIFGRDMAFSYKENYQAYSKYLLDNFEISKDSIDQSCASISKACFLCHDADVYLNPIFKQGIEVEKIPFLHIQKPEELEENNEHTFEVNTFELSQFLFKPVVLNFEKRNAVENFIALCRVCIKHNGDFIEGNRHNWVLKLAVLCNSFGMDKNTAIRHFKCVFANHPAIALSKHPFDETGDLTRPFDDMYEKYLDDFETWNDRNEVFTTPCLPKEVFDNSPHFVKKLTGLFPDERERDVFFLGLLTLASTCFPLVQGVYDSRRYRANLFTFISAPAASGKGVLSWVSKMGDAIHENFLNEFKRDFAEYQALNEEQRKEQPKPELKRLFIAADNTSANMIADLSINQLFGIIYDNEADTLTKANKSEHGNFSNLLRKFFQHETIHYERKTNNQNIIIKEPACSILISGTPGQIDKMVDDVENGLVSRFIFYNYVSPVKWKDVFADGQDFHGIFKSSAVELLQLTNQFFYDFLSNPEREILFELTSDQKKKRSDWFEEKTKNLDELYGSDIRGSVMRLGLIQFRIAMVLSSIRTAENTLGQSIKERSKIVCTDGDFNASMSIVDVLLHHAVNVFNKLKKRGVVKRNGNPKDNYYESLPIKFNRAKAMEIASYSGIKEKTAENYLRQLAKDEKLKKPQHNHYEKGAA